MPRKIPAYQTVSLILICLRAGLKDIADTPYRRDHLLLKASVDLRTKSADKYIDDVGLGVKTVLPDMFQNHGFGHHLAGVSHEIFQKGKFTRLKIDAALSAKHLACQEVHREIADRQRRRRRK